MPERWTSVSPVIAALSICACAPTSSLQAVSPPAIETVASYPHGQFLENLHVAPDGSVLVTSYIDRTLLRWDGDGPPQPLARLTAHPVGVLTSGDRIIVSAHGAPFTQGPAFTRTNQVLVLDRSGAILRQTALPDAMFLNGLVELDADRVLIADSLAGTIWAYRPSTGEVVPWLRDPLLGTDPGSTEQRPGANGLKRRGDWLYVSNSSRGAIYRISIANGAPEGALSVFASSGPVDDFAFATDGSIVAATHGPRLIRIDANGRVSDIISDGCDACTSVARLRNGDLIVTTSGNLLEGGEAPARLLRVRAPRHP